jgi:excisionase family DNA binding protein
MTAVADAGNPNDGEAARDSQRHTSCRTGLFVATRGAPLAKMSAGCGKIRPVSSPSDLNGTDRVLDAEGAAALLHVSTKTVLRLARAGELPSRKVGREWRFETSALLDHVAGRRFE